MLNRSCFFLVLCALCSNLARAAAPSDALGKAPSRFAKSGDIKVHYKSFAAEQDETKPALVFIHGWCCDMTVWRDQAAAFDRKSRMIFIDLPGYGKSDHPPISYTMDVFAKAINAVLEDAKVNRAVLIGHSMGTPVVRQFYRQYPAKTAALVFVDGGLRPMVRDRDQAEQFLARFKEETFKDDSTRFLSNMVSQSAPDDIKDRLAAMIQNTEFKVAMSSMRGMFDADWTEDPIKVPAQALMAKSRFWTDEYKDFVKKLAPEIDYREFEGVGHFLFMEKPEEFNTALTEFLKKQRILN